MLPDDFEGAREGNGTNPLRIIGAIACAVVTATNSGCNAGLPSYTRVDAVCNLRENDECTIEVHHQVEQRLPSAHSYPEYDAVERCCGGSRHVQQPQRPCRECYYYYHDSCKQCAYHRYRHECNYQHEKHYRKEYLYESERDLYEDYLCEHNLSCGPRYQYERLDHVCFCRCYSYHEYRQRARVRDQKGTHLYSLCSRRQNDSRHYHHHECDYFYHVAHSCQCGSRYTSDGYDYLDVHDERYTHQLCYHDQSHCHEIRYQCIDRGKQTPYHLAQFIRSSNDHRETSDHIWYLQYLYGKVNSINPTDPLYLAMLPITNFTNDGAADEEVFSEGASGQPVTFAQHRRRGRFGLGNPISTPVPKQVAHPLYTAPPPIFAPPPPGAQVSADYWMSAMHAQQAQSALHRGNPWGPEPIPPYYRCGEDGERVDEVGRPCWWNEERATRASREMFFDFRRFVGLFYWNDAEGCMYCRPCRKPATESHIDSVLHFKAAHNFNPPHNTWDWKPGWNVDADRAWRHDTWTYTSVYTPWHSICPEYPGNATRDENRRQIRPFDKLRSLAPVVPPGLPLTAPPPVVGTSLHAAAVVPAYAPAVTPPARQIEDPWAVSVRQNKEEAAKASLPPAPTPTVGGVPVSATTADDSTSSTGARGGDDISTLMKAITRRPDPRA